MLSSKIKKISLSPRSQAIKRDHGDEDFNKKRAKSDNENLLTDSHFIRACEQVSRKVDEDKLIRFPLPSCLRNCKGSNYKNQEQKSVMQPHVEETFKIEMRANKWYEALDASFLSITPTQFLSENVLKNIVEIMLNAHEDPLSEYHMTFLIEKCQQALSLNIRMHPPSSIELWKCYNNFLTSPMELKEKTLTNRKEYGSDSGIFKYCVNRLLYEFNTDSKDGPFFNKEEEIPEYVQQKIQEMHWVKSRLEIYEMLDRTERIDRLMAVMDSMTELLGFDLAIWQSRQVNESRGSNRHQKLLMTQILSSKRIQPTMLLNDTCMQIMKIFVYLVHLNYPEKYIRTMSLWINIFAESLRIIGNPLFDDISDFYRPIKTDIIFADQFYEIIEDLPPESIYKILERITPARIKYSIGVLHVRKLLSDANNENIIRIFINFMKKCQWNNFPEAIAELKNNKKEILKSSTSDNILKHLTNICKNHLKTCSNETEYLKFTTHDSNFEIDRNYVMRIFYITLQAYLDTYNVHRFQKTLLQLNSEINDNKLLDSKEQAIKHHFKSIRRFINMYREIYMDLKEYFSVIKSLKSKNELPEDFYIFEKIIDLNEL